MSEFNPEEKKVSIDTLLPNGPIDRALNEENSGFQNTYEKAVGPQTLSAGELIGNLVMQDGYMRSGNYVQNVSGWKIFANGVIEAVGAILSGAVTATSGVIGGFTVTATALYGGIIKTSATAGDGTSNSAGVLMDETGVYGCGANQDTSDANVRIKTDGSFFTGSENNYLHWDGSFLRLKGSLSVGESGVINNSVYTVANLPVPATVVGFNPPSATDADYSAVVADSYSESNQNTQTQLTPNQTKYSQTFTNTTASILDSCKFYLKKFGVPGLPTGNAVAKIYAITGTYGTNAKPTGTALATSDNFDVSTLTTSFALTTFSFTGANRINLTANTNYALTIEYVPVDYDNVVAVGLDSSSPSHSGNYALYTVASGTWSGGSGSLYDFPFYLYTKLGNFTNPSNVYTSNNVYATAVATSGALVVDLSYDGGTSWTNTLTKTFTGSDSALTYGAGSTELWGRSWTRADMVDANFRVRVTHGNFSQIYKTFGFTTGTDILTGIEVSIEANYATATLSIDLVNVKIYYGTSVLTIQAGSMAYASNGRKAGEGAGAGTGVLVFRDGSNWIATDTGATVAA